MILVPNSESLQEMNSCHAPDSGQFCSGPKGAPKHWTMFHGSRTDTFTGGRLRGDAAGVVYLAFEPDVASFYGTPYKTEVVVRKTLRLGSDPYDHEALYRHLEGAALEQARKRLLWDPSEEGKPGIFAAIRDAVVVGSLRASGYDSVVFADDHSPGWRPAVMAVLDPSLVHAPVKT